MSGKSTFDFDKMQEVMGEISEEFGTLSSLLDKTTKAVTDAINVSPDSAVYGIVGDDLLDLWDANSSTFGDFKKNFEVWAETMTVIRNRSVAFDEEAVAAFKGELKETFEGNKTTALSLDGVQENRTFQALSDGYNYVGYDSDGSVDGKFDDMVVNAGVLNKATGEYEYVGTDGTKLGYSVDSNGNITSLTTYNANGHPIETKNFDLENGGVSSRITYSGGAAIEEFYDKNGVPINTATYSVTDGEISGMPNRVTYVENGQTYTAFVNITGGYDVYAGTTVSGAALLTGLTLENVMSKVQVNRGRVDNSYTLQSVEKGYTGEYDGRTILIPNVSDADFDACASYEEREALMFSNAKVIVDSGMKVTETLDSEVAVLTQLRTQYTNNPAALEIIDNEIAARTEISQTIKDDCHQGSGTDGDVGDASAGHAGHSDTWMGGWVEEQFVDYDQAVTAAGNWNAKLSGLTDMSDLEAALEAANLTEVMSDVPSTGGGTETVSTEIGSEAPTGEIIVDTPIDTGIATV